MRKSIFTLAIATSLMAIPFMASAANNLHPNELEPCINGAVSSKGLFATQAQEDEHERRIAKARVSRRK